jgi:hypothetical protein
LFRREPEVRRLPFFLLLALPLLSSAGWVDGSGQALPDTDSMQSAGALVVKLALTQDEVDLRRAWEASTTAPKLHVTTATQLGSTVSTVLVFQGCAVDTAGNCDVDVEFHTVSPDGQAQPGGAGKVWAAQPLAQRFMLGAASVALRFDAPDDIGLHTVRATVTDRVAHRSLELATQVLVGP